MNIFLSFSGDGRQKFAMDFLTFFSNHGFKCWYDQHELFLGDILSETIIQKGLKKTEYAILIINEAFLLREWPRTEAKILYDRAKKRETTLFPLLWNVTKDQVLESDIAFLLEYKYQFVDEKTPFEVVAYQIMNRILHDVITSKYHACTLEDVKKHSQSLSLPKGLDVFNCLNILSQVSPLSYEVQATILIVIIKLLDQKKHEKLINMLSYRLYTNKPIYFDICKILENILIVNYYSYIN